MKKIMNIVYLTALATLIGSFVMVMYLIPKIKYIVERRNLIDHPDKRSSHKNLTPTMAGVAFFLTLIFALNLLDTWDVDGVGINLIAALTIIFALGLKDDLIISTPKAKIGGEILAISFIMFCNCMQITSLDGFLGINEISPLVSYVLITLMILTIVNSYNLIDGIDGLASTIGIVIFSTFGFIFFIAGLHFYFIFCLCLVGMQVAYLRYNLSKTKKIFMGDTGSLTIGFCIGFLSLKFLSLDALELSALSFIPENKLFVIVSILFIPLFDTLRVIGVRLMNKKGPFTPDKNHIHHVLIDSGLSHVKASVFLGFLSLGLSVFFISLSLYIKSFQMLVVLAISFLLLLTVFDRLKNNVRTENRFKYLVRAIHFLF
ncbi:glycosyltransferase family 4 protein [Pareuzebyella sediminis]|uniref:glycosyltransferase family 4 protein n=1 Tax=Pareuzebyella sediminis TaxID=2607998 RepID=UPI0018E0F934|nr:MraY family glycosyltransferase [Pareuzebyella sediminis]